MARMMLKCETTGKEVQVGFPIDRKDFEAAPFGKSAFGPCPECGRIHVWTKQDVTLRE